MAKPFKFRYVNEIVGGFVLLVGVAAAGGGAGGRPRAALVRGEIRDQPQLPAEGSMDLQKGAEVMLLGAKVGSVQDIVVNDDGHISGVMRIRGPFMRFVRADSIALVKKKMVVTGDAYIELTRGTGAELPRTGGEIECVKDTEILEMLQEALETIRKEAVNTLTLVNGAIAEYTDLAAGMNDPDGSLQQLLANSNGLLMTCAGPPPAKILNDPGMAMMWKHRGADSGADGQDQRHRRRAANHGEHHRAGERTVADEVDNLPVLTGDAQTLMWETTALLDGLQTLAAAEIYGWMIPARPEVLVP